MNNDDRLGLVPRTAGEIERIEPGARRVISGMVSDTLALAALNMRRQSRPPRIVIMDDEPTVGEIVEAVIRSLVSDATILRDILDAASVKATAPTRAEMEADVAHYAMEPLFIPGVSDTI